MDYERPYTTFFWLTCLALVLCIGASGDVVEDLLLEAASPLSSDTLPNTEVENAAEDLLVPSARFVSLPDCHEFTFLPIEDANDSSVPVDVAQRSWANGIFPKEWQASSPTGFLRPLRI
jgi:hypothetical protein